MNRDQMQGKWMQSAGKARELWGILTGDEKITLAGKRDQIAGLLQQRYGEAMEKAERQLDRIS